MKFFNIITLKQYVCLLGLFLLTSCASYEGSWRDRGRDAADIITFKVEAMSFGIEAKVGPITAGSFIKYPQAGGLGLQGGEFGDHSFSGSDEVLFNGDIGFDMTYGIGLGTGLCCVHEERMIFELPRGKEYSVQKGMSRSQYYRLGVRAGAILRINFEFNVGELADFVLGYFDFDPIDDDLYKKEEAKEIQLRYERQVVEMRKAEVIRKQKALEDEEIESRRIKTEVKFPSVEK
ncbi:MAG: hypothetical protein IPQ05_21120 [Leptospiraceae bacterium]|nr:hypothetical protein [Leptospiraceae bacterium]